jgi:hypothetical protein
MKNLYLDYYINEGDKITDRSWLTLTVDQKTTLATKLCYFYNRLDQLPEYDQEELLAFIHTVVVNGKDFTAEHMDSMNTLSKRRGQKNPFGMEVGDFNPSCRSNNYINVKQYRNAIRLVIPRKQYTWTYEDMVTMAKAHNKGIPVTELALDEMFTVTDVANIHDRFDRFADAFRELENKYERKIEIMEEQMSGMALCIAELENKLAALFPTPRVVVDNTKIDNDLVAKIKARLNHDDDDETIAEMQADLERIES